MKRKAITNVVVKYTKEEYPQLKEILLFLGYEIFGGEELEFTFRNHDCLIISDDRFFQNFDSKFLILPRPILTFDEFKNKIETINEEINDFMESFPTHESIEKYLVSRGFDLDELKSDFEELKRNHEKLN